MNDLIKYVYSSYLPQEEETTSVRRFHVNNNTNIVRVSHKHNDESSFGI